MTLSLSGLLWWGYCCMIGMVQCSFDELQISTFSWLPFCQQLPSGSSLFLSGPDFGCNWCLFCSDVTVIVPLCQNSRIADWINHLVYCLQSCAASHKCGTIGSCPGSFTHKGGFWGSGEFIKFQDRMVLQVGSKLDCQFLVTNPVLELLENGSQVVQLQCVVHFTCLCRSGFSMTGWLMPVW